MMFVSLNLFAQEFSEAAPRTPAETEDRNAILNKFSRPQTAAGINAPGITCTACEAFEKLKGLLGDINKVFHRGDANRITPVNPDGVGNSTN